MRAKTVNFERGLDPKAAMGIGDPKSVILKPIEDKVREAYIRNKSLTVNYDLKKPWAVCFEVEQDYGHDTVFLKSDFIIKSIWEFWNDKPFIQKINELVIPHIIEYNNIFKKYKNGIKSPKRLIAFFEDCLDNETFLSGFSPLEADTYLMYVENEIDYNLEEEDQ